MQPYGHHHDPRMRGPPTGMDLAYYNGPPARPHMPPAMSAPNVPVTGMHPGHPGVPPPMPPQEAPMSDGKKSRRNSIPSIRKIGYSLDLAFSPEKEEVVTLPNNATAFITTNATSHNEMLHITPLLEAGPSSWLNPFLPKPTPNPELYDTPIKVPKIRLTLPFTSEEMFKQEKWISFCFAISGEKGYLKLLAFERRADALREMLYHAMNGYSIVWSGAYLKDGKPWSGGGKLSLVDNVEGAMKVDEEEGNLGVIA